MAKTVWLVFTSDCTAEYLQKVFESSEAAYEYAATFKSWEFPDVQIWEVE